MGLKFQRGGAHSQRPGLKSDQNGIEIEHDTGDAGDISLVKIRPKWD